MLDESRVETPETPAPEGATPEPEVPEVPLEDDADDSEESPQVPTVPTVPISELRKVRTEAAKYRKELVALKEQQEADAKKARLAKMEETDRLKAIAEEAEAKAKALKQRADTVAKKAAIISSAATLGFRNPKLVANHLNLADITIDDDGTVDDDAISLQLEALKESDSYLLREENQPQAPPDAFGGPTNPAPPKDSVPMPKLHDAEKIKQMKQQSNKAMGEGKVKAAIELYNRAWEMERGVKKK